jgi:hypothetical protein
MQGMYTDSIHEKVQLFLQEYDHSQLLNLCTICPDPYLYNFIENLFNAENEWTKTKFIALLQKTNRDKNKIYNICVDLYTDLQKTYENWLTTDNKQLFWYKHGEYDGCVVKSPTMASWLIKNDPYGVILLFTNTIKNKDLVVTQDIGYADFDYTTGQYTNNATFCLIFTRF